MRVCVCCYNTKFVQEQQVLYFVVSVYLNYAASEMQPKQLLGMKYVMMMYSRVVLEGWGLQVVCMTGCLFGGLFWCFGLFFFKVSSWQVPSTEENSWKSGKSNKRKLL